MRFSWLIKPLFCAQMLVAIVSGSLGSSLVSETRVTLDRSWPSLNVSDALDALWSGRPLFHFSLSMVHSSSLVPSEKLTLGTGRPFVATSTMASPGAVQLPSPSRTWGPAVGPLFHLWRPPLLVHPLKLYASYVSCPVSSVPSEEPDRLEDLEATTGTVVPVFPRLAPGP